VIGHQPAKVAWLGNPGNVATEINLAAVRQSAEQMGIKLELFEAREPTDLDRVFPAMVDCDAVLVQLDPLTDPTASKSLSWRNDIGCAPSITTQNYVVDGGLISYGTDVRDNWRTGASYVDRILRGARPRAVYSRRWQSAQRQGSSVPRGKRANAFGVAGNRVRMIFVPACLPGFPSTTSLRPRRAGLVSNHWRRCWTVSGGPQTRRCCGTMRRGGSLQHLRMPSGGGRAVARQAAPCDLRRGP
jgi:hypothetical protein